MAPPSAYRGHMTLTADTHPTVADAYIRAPRRTAPLELSRSECLALLATTNLGRLAISGPRDRAPIIRPVSYVFDERSQSIVFRTALGSKFRALLVMEQAAFEIDGIDRGDRTAWSVIVSGVTEEITSPDEIERMAAIAHESWAPGDRHYWARIRAYTVSGRRIVRRMFDSEPQT